MQTQQRNNPYSGLISILGLITLLIGFIVMILLPSIRYVAWLVLLLGIALLAVAFVIDFRRIRGAITGRRGRFSTGTTVMVSIFIGIAILINAISIGNYHRFDATGVAQFTLTPQTQDALKELETPIKVLCFFTPEDPTGGLNSYISNLLNEYQNYTDKLKVEVIDPDEHPDQARQYGIQIYSTVVFETQNRHRLVSPQDIVQTTVDQQGNPQIVGVEAEHAFTSAILEVSGIVQKKVYFLTGHGESDISSTASNGYSRAREDLLDNLYKVAYLDLMLTGSIPKDCAALIIAAPQKSLSTAEVKIIKDYLDNDGRVLLLVNPNPLPEIKQLISTWGINIEDGTLIDRASYVTPSIDSPLVPRTRNFFDLPETYFPGATAIIPKEEAIAGIEMLPLVWSSTNSWLESNFSPKEEPEFNEGDDRQGPLAIGVLIAAVPTEEAENVPQDETGTLFIIIGDSDFASNEHYFNGNNGDLFLSAVNVLTWGTELVSLERKVLPFRRLVVGPEATNFINYSSVVLLPILILLTGGIMWWRRR